MSAAAASPSRITTLLLIFLITVALFNSQSSFANAAVAENAKGDDSDKSSAPKENLSSSTTSPASTSTPLIIPFKTSDKKFFAITGLVTKTSARILYFTKWNQEMRVLKLVSSSSLSGDEASLLVNGDKVKTASLVEKIAMKKTPEVPRVVKIDNLTPDTEYMVQFSKFASDDEENQQDLHHYTLHFRTLGVEYPYRQDLNAAAAPLSRIKSDRKNLSTEAFKVISLSCDRFFDDEDSSMWEYMAQRNETYDLMVHLGDQIYGDRLLKEHRKLYEKSNKDGSASIPSVEQFLDEFRRLYHLYYERASVREVFRRGAHVMLPDDHDIMNNVNRLMLKKSESDPMLRNFIIAGRRAYLEFQYQLMGDIPENFPYQELTESVDVWNFDSVRTDGLCIMFLDTRYETTFRNKGGDYPLLGERQHKKLLEAVARCPKDNKIVLYSSIPMAQFDEYCARVVDIAEEEYYASHPSVSKEVLRLFDELSPYQDRILFVGGDIHQHLKSRLIRYGRPSAGETPSILHFATSSGISEGSRVMNEFKLYLFNLFVHYWSYGFWGSWRIEHYKYFFGKNYLVLHRGNEMDSLYDVEGLTYYPVYMPLSSFTEQVLHFVFGHFVFVEILGILVLGIIGQHIFAHPGYAEDEMKKTKEE